MAFPSITTAALAATALADECSLLHLLVERQPARETLNKGRIVSMLRNGTSSFCNTNEYCEGLYINYPSSQAAPLPCPAAHQVLIRSRFNRRIDNPPILSDRNRDWREITQAYMSQGPVSVNPFAGIPDSMALLLKTIEQQCRKLVDVTIISFPRLVYRDDVEGETLRILVNTTRGLKGLVAANPTTWQRVRQYLFSSLHVRAVGWHLSNMLQQIAYFELRNQKNIIISMSSILHAFFEFGYTMDLDYATIVAGNEWIIEQLSTIHPLYDNAADVWNLPMPNPLSRMEIDIPLPIGHQMNWDQLKESVWNDEPLPTESPHGLLDIVMSTITTLNTWMTSFERSIPRMRDIRPWSRANAVALIVGSRTTRKQFKRALFTLRYLEEYEPRKNYPWRLNNDTRQSLNESSIQQVKLFIAKQEKFYLLLGGDQPTVASLVYVFRDILDFGSKLFHPRSRFHIHKRLLPKMNWEPETLEKYVDNIMSLSRMDLVFLNRPTNPHVQFPRILSLLFRSLLIRDGTKIVLKRGDHHEASLRALGRTIALILNQPSGGPSILRPYLEPLAARKASVFETIFFGSMSIRRGVHDVFPYGHIERVFRNGRHLLESIPTP